MSEHVIDTEFVERQNAEVAGHLDRDYETLGEKLQRRGIDIEAITRRVQSFGVAVPSWGVGTGGTRFGRFPRPGEPRNVFDKLQDCGVIHQLCRSTPRVSLHFPWDRVNDPNDLLEAGERFGLGFDAVNSNTFQDQPGQEQSYKFGSLTHTDASVRQQAVEHNVECIETGQILGAKALTVWIADGANFPGQQSLRAAFDRYLESMQKIYAALPEDWNVFLEHKLFEPAFYTTVIADWGSSYLAATMLGPKARCLVDLGHHAPNTNIEMIVARLIKADRLAGFHFNDSKYGDDDLDTGSIAPFQLFLIFNELVSAEEQYGSAFAPAYMLDQSHNVTDPIESLMNSAIEVNRAYAQAVLVDRDALAHHQSENDALMALNTVKQAFRCDVDPILAMARKRSGGAIDPIATVRASGYRDRVASERPAQNSFGGGIV